MRAFSCRGWPAMWNAQLRGSGLKPNVERVPREAILVGCDPDASLV